MIAALLLAAGAACGRGEKPAPAPSLGAALTPAPDEGARAVLFLGTSLTAGLGVAPEEAYPALVQQRIDATGLHYRVVNAGLSGETSAGARRRVDWVLARPVSVLVVETGANDGLRGQDPDSVRARIQRIFDRARALDPPPRLVIAGMEALPNLGADYGRRFRAIYPALASNNDAALIPFLLDGVAGVDSLNQQDGIHPTAQGQRVVAENVWVVIERVTR